MRNLIPKLAAAALCSLFILPGCIKDDDAKISVSAYELIFEAEGNTPQTITVTAENSTWSAVAISDDSDPWIIMEEGAGSVTVNVNDNTLGPQRNGNVVIKSASGAADDKVVVIKQKGLDDALSVNPKVLIFFAENNTTKYASVTAPDIEWNVEVVGEAKGWLHAAPEHGNDRIAVTVDNNPEIETREGKVRIFGTGGSPQVFLHVTQSDNRPATVIQTDLTTVLLTDISPKPQTVTVMSNGLWVAEPKAGDDWYDIEISDNVLTVTAETLSGTTFRKGKITIFSAAEANPVEITVIQGVTETIDFVQGRINYYANEFENETASYYVQMLSGDGRLDEVGSMNMSGWYAQMQTIGKAPAPPYDKFDIPPGRYIASSAYSAYTFFRTYRGYMGIMGSTLTLFVNDSWPCLTSGFTEGFMDIEFDGEKYDISIRGLSMENVIIDTSFSGEMPYYDFSEFYPGYE